MLESDFQRERVIEMIMRMFPGAFVLKNDPNYIRSFPDLTVLHGDRWVVLETKRAKNSDVRANQEYYIDKLNDMSFASFIYPSNAEEVLRELQRTFRS